MLLSNILFLTVTSTSGALLGPIINFEKCVVFWANPEALLNKLQQANSIARPKPCMR